jgi:hypothetical protein
VQLAGGDWAISVVLQLTADLPKQQPQLPRRLTSAKQAPRVKVLDPGRVWDLLQQPAYLTSAIP